MKTTTATLTNRAGRTTRARVTYHTPIHAAARTQCGLTFEALRGQDFNTHQTALSADLSDVNCPDCKAKAGQAVWIDSETYVAPAAKAAWYAARTDGQIRCAQAGAWDANDRETYAACRAELERRASGSATLVIKLVWHVH